MMRVLHGSLAALLGAVCALAVGCGDDNLLSGSDADALKGSLADLQAAVEDGDCAEVDQQISALREDLKRVPRSVDRRLRNRLTQEISGKLAPQSQQECAASTTQETPVEPVEPATTEELPPPTTTEEVPPPVTTDEVPTDEVPTDELPPTPTNETPTPDPNADPGGISPDDGFSSGENG